MADPKDEGESFASMFERSPGAKRGARTRFEVGQRVEVSVVAVTGDAVFADLGRKQEGIFERAELCDADGKLRVAPGARVSAVVAGIDASTGQVRLAPVAVRAAAGGEEAGSAASGVALPATPKGAPLLVEGARVQGAVAGVERYGVFVQIAGTSGRAGRGLVPASETGTPRGADLRRHFAPGQAVSAKILSVAEDGKIRLSISALRADEERADFEAFAGAERSRVGEGADPGRGGGLGTLGEAFKRTKR